VSASVFKQGQTKYAIAGWDLAMVFPKITDSVREKISDSGFPADQILIHGSETHNGPD
jgi:hypothetical protein